jgi:tetratricopeptide (TPR) repeat protein
MAFEKAKVLKAAEKFLSQGKINAAIKEYRQIVENDEDDLTALNMLGDLCARASKTDEAISCFHRIAEHYGEQEFTLKAIAMYKKIERLKPHDPEIASKLANLYATQGLVVDARAQYLIVADAFTRAGQTKKALEIFHRIADLDPQNTDIRLKLAEGYLKEGLKPEAADAFIQAGRRFYDTGVFQRSLDSFTKALELTNDRNPVLRGILAAHVALGTAEDAVELIDNAVHDRPDDRELVLMLLEACLEAEDAKGAERAASVLIKQDPSEYSRIVPVAKLYLKVGEVDETTRLLTGIVEQMLSGRDEKELLEIVNEVLTRNPDQVGALRLLVRVYWWQRDMEALRAALERLAEAAEAGGHVEEERYALTQLVRLAPDEQKFADRLKEIGGFQETAAEEPLMSPDSFAQVPEFESFAVSGNEEAEMVPNQHAQFEWEVVSAEGKHDPTASFAELSENYNQSPIAVESEFESHRSPDALKSVAQQTESVSQPAESASDENSDARREAMMRQELESVDFYLAQGYSDIAADTLQMLERQFGGHPEILKRRERLQDHATTPVKSTPEVFEFGGADALVSENQTAAAEIETESSFVPSPVDAPVVQGAAPEATKPAAPALDAGLAEIFEEFRIAAEDEQPSSKGDYETHYNMGTAYKEMDLLDDAINEFQTAASLVRPDDGTSHFLQCCNLLGHCFVQKEMPRAAAIWFQKALDAAKGEKEEEQKALRYELATVFEQMGETDRAVNLFTEIYGVDVNYRQVAEKLRKLAPEKYKSKGKNRNNRSQETN